MNALRSGPGIAAAPVDLVLNLLPLLDRQVSRGLALSVDTDEDEIPDSVLNGLTESLDASLGLLGLIVAEGVDKKLLVEEYIENCILLCKHILQRSIFPVLDPSCDAAAVHARRKGSSADGKGPELLKGNDSGTEKSKTKGKHGSKSKKKNSDKNIQMMKQLSRLRSRICELLERLEELVTVVKLEDKMILQLSATNLSLFFVDNGIVPGAAPIFEALQLSGLQVMQAIFAQYPQHRSVILEDLFGLLVKLPNNKRSLRSYRTQADQHIQMVSALVMLLVQSSVVEPLVLEAAPESAVTQSPTKSSKMAAKATAPAV